MPSILLLLAFLWGHPHPPGQILIVRLYVPTEMATAFALETRDVATRILDRADISVVWLMCPSGDAADRRCTLPIDPAEIVVRTLVDRRTPDRCGEAYLPQAGNGQMITLFLTCSEQVARRAPISAAAVHGHMLVHELGHLLLGPRHALNGIMQCPLELHDWHAAAFGRLGFMSAEIPALKRAAATRWSVMAAVE